MNTIIFPVENNEPNSKHGRDVSRLSSGGPCNAIRLLTRKQTGISAVQQSWWGHTYQP